MQLCSSYAHYIVYNFSQADRIHFYNTSPPGYPFLAYPPPYWHNKDSYGQMDLIRFIRTIRRPFLPIFMAFWALLPLHHILFLHTNVCTTACLHKNMFQKQKRPERHENWMEWLYN